MPVYIVEARVYGKGIQKRRITAISGDKARDKARLKLREEYPSRAIDVFSAKRK